MEEVRSTGAIRQCHLCADRTNAGTWEARKAKTASRKTLLTLDTAIGFTLSSMKGEPDMKKWYALAAVVLAAVGAKAATLFAAVSSTGRCPLCHH